MSDIKSAISRAQMGRMTVSRSGVDAGSLDHLRPFQPKAPPAADRKVTPAGGRGDAKAIAEFVAPSRETAHWLGNPAIAGVLSSVSQELAPDGVAQSSRDQYVASVVETHLSARRQLARHLNALLRA